MELPERIEETLERIRRERSHYVDVKIIGRRCYVYESTSKWDRVHRKVKKTSTYIGRITSDGIFIKSSPRSPGLRAALIEGAKTSRPASARPAEPRAGKGRYDVQILTALSSNGRSTVSELGKMIGLKNTAAEAQRNNVEKRYGIRYIAEIDVNKLGYLTYFVFIKFENKKPSMSLAKVSLEKEPHIQLAMLTYGRYDIIMYIVISEYEDLKDQLYSIRDSIFADYDLKLYVAPFYPGYCFVPLRGRFFDMLKERVWARSSEKPRPRPGELLRREYAVLKELSENGKEEFTEIDERYGLAEGSARYTYHRLVEKGIIKRITVSMHNLPLKYISAIFLQKINQVKYRAYRPRILQHIITDFEGSVTNRYALEGDIKTPEGVFFLLPAFNDRDVMAVDSELRAVQGTEVDSMIVTSVPVGSLCYRKFDRKLTNQYNILKEAYGIEA